MNHLALGYVIIETEHRAATDTVLSDVVGLAPAGVNDSMSVWRNDSRARRLVLVDGPGNDVAAVGLAASSAMESDALASAVTALGHVITQGSSEDCAERGVASLWRVTSPSGIPFEIVTDQADASTPIDTPLMAGGFVTGSMGLGHVVCFTADLAADEKFLIEGLGFGRSDSLHLAIAPEVDVFGGFYHANGRHHTIAIIQPPFMPPARLHHVMLEAAERNDVGYAFDRAHSAGLPLPNGLGRHPNDQVFSFYMRTPAGFEVEIGYGGVVVDDDWTGDRVYNTISEWGHQPVAR